VFRTCGEEAQDPARNHEKVLGQRERDTHLAETGHGEVRVATAELGTGLAYGDGKFLKIVVEFERGVEGDKVCEGGGKGRGMCSGYYQLGNSHDSSRSEPLRSHIKGSRAGFSHSR